ncbi:GEM-like protein 5 [Mangifera indica]|uniref:GEM-like protein 5 n=1 Tax=Mangifera indica TaxID=29780 RepID=UPI001CFBE73E|nr:GEM-like protein 5 [Mangifera indica]
MHSFTSPRLKYPSILIIPPSNPSEKPLVSEMNNTNGQESHPHYPSVSSPNPNYETNPFASSSSSAQNRQSDHHHQPAGPSSASAPESTAPDAEKWGTHVMGAPAVPTCHPDNKKAALWGGSADHDNQAQQPYHHPYLLYTPVEKPSSPMESILNVFNSWSNKAETMANNIWHNLRTNSSVPEAAWGKMSLNAKALTGGGFETVYKQTFGTYPNENLKKTFACYLSTSTGPVAGTLYLSNVHLAFCSDRPLSFTAPSGQKTWSYYKVMVPLAMIGTVKPVVMRENPSEKYIQIVTVDGHEFWFMGFVNYDKACRHLSESISIFVAPGVPAQPTA